MANVQEVTLDGVTYEIDIDEMLASGLFTNVSPDQQQGSVAPDELPKTRPEGALSEEDAKYLEFYRKIQDEKHNTQPLATPAETPIYPGEASIREATRIFVATHQHHFTYLLNQGHTALRGCSCGLAFVGLMYGDVRDLKWHQVHEEGERVIITTEKGKK